MGLPNKTADSLRNERRSIESRSDVYRAPVGIVYRRDLTYCTRSIAGLITDIGSTNTQQFETNSRPPDWAYYQRPPASARSHTTPQLHTTIGNKASGNAVEAKPAVGSKGRYTTTLLTSQIEHEVYKNRVQGLNITLQIPQARQNFFLQAIQI